jgi:trigger factor
MRATAEPVEGNQIRLSVEIDEPEIERVLDETVRSLSRQARIPGFRPGRVPRRVLEAHMGGPVALRAEALREALPDFYAQAVADAEVDPIAPPEIDITSGEEHGPLAFDALVQIRPTVAIPGYGGLVVTVPSPVVTDDEIDRQLDLMRDTEAELVEVGRPAVDGDNVTIDLRGTGGDGEEVVNLEDFMYEVGSGRVAPELDVELRGAKVGDILAFTATRPGSPEVAFRVLVKDVKEKRLPHLTDEWAAESSEFSTVAELREDLGRRIGTAKGLQARFAKRENALTALAELVDEAEVPDILVEEEVRQRVHDLSHRLEEQRISIEQFLEATGRTGEELVAQVRVESQRAVRADLALRALADAEALEVTDDDLTAEIEAMAARLETEPEALRQQLDRAGRTAAVRSEQRKSKALTWLLDHVGMVDEEGNEVTGEELTEPDPTDSAPGLQAAGSEPAAAGDTEQEEADPASGAAATTGKTEGVEA